MPPTMPPIPGPDDPAVKLLVSWYQQMEATLVNTLVEATLEGWEEDQIRGQMRQLRAEMRRLQGKAGAWDEEQLARMHRAGQAYADAYLRELEGLPDDAITEPFTLPREALTALANDAAGQRAPFLTAILRQSDDYLQRLAAGEIAQGLGLGKDSYAVGKAIREGLIEGVRTGAVQREIANGILTATGVVYSDGSVHSMHAYGQMSGRTGLAHALREGQLDRFRQTGMVHLVKIPTNGTLCHLCFYTEGRCYAIDAEGEALGYPPLSAWYETGAGHPACRHIAFIPVVRPTADDLPPDAFTRTSTKSDLYHRFRDEHDVLYRASRQGFGNTAELRQWQKANPDVPFEELRGPRWRYQGIETRRQAAIAEMLDEPGLRYADAVERQTRQFMASKDYADQVPSKTPAAQARAARTGA